MVKTSYKSPPDGSVCSLHCFSQISTLFKKKLIQNGAMSISDMVVTLSTCGSYLNINDVNV